MTQDLKELMIENRKSVEKVLSTMEYPFSVQKAFIPVLVNNCKVEYHNSVGAFRIGYKLTESDLDIIQSYAEEEYGSNFKIKRSKNCVDIRGMYSSSDFVKFIEFVDSIEGLDIDISSTHKYTGGKSTRGKIEKQDFESVCVGILLANRVKYAVDNQDPGVLSRDLMDSIDDQITIAQSINYKNKLGNRYREHAVPCDLLYREAVVMYEEGAKLYQIANMFKQNLLIVLITSKEADLLDNKLSLKTEMPDDWKVGDSPFARFDFAGIELTNL
jgi:hypothetical protein